MRQVSLLSALISLTILSCSVGWSQDPNPAAETGIKPYGSYHGGNIDTINLSNGEPSVDIPLISYPQRGGKLKLDFVLHYENRGWWSTSVCEESSEGTTCSTSWPETFQHGFNIVEANTPSDIVGSRSSIDPSNSLFTADAQIYMQDGPVHQLAAVSPVNTSGTSTNWASLDASGFVASFDTLNLLGGVGGNLQQFAGAPTATIQTPKAFTTQPASHRCQDRSSSRTIPQASRYRPQSRTRTGTRSLSPGQLDGRTR